MVTNAVRGLSKTVRGQRYKGYANRGWNWAKNTNTGLGFNKFGTKHLTNFAGSQRGQKYLGQFGRNPYGGQVLNSYLGNKFLGSKWGEIAFPNYVGMNGPAPQEEYGTRKRR